MVCKRPEIRKAELESLGDIPRSLLRLRNNQSEVRHSRMF